MPPKGKPLPPDHKAAIAAAKLKEQQALALLEDLEEETEDHPGATDGEYAEVADLLDALPEGQLADLHAVALQVIKDALTGLKVLVHPTDGKTPQLLKGTAALWKLDTPEGGVWVYQHRPDIKLAQFVTQHAEGKPGTKELQARATTVIFHSTLPGQDAAINSYLAGLPSEVLDKFGFDNETLKAIKGE